MMDEVPFLIFEADGRSLIIEAEIVRSPYGGPVAVPFSIIHTPAQSPEFMGLITAYPESMERNGQPDPKKRYRITIEEVRGLTSKAKKHE